MKTITASISVCVQGTPGLCPHDKVGECCRVLAEMLSDIVSTGSSDSLPIPMIAVKYKEVNMNYRQQQPIMLYIKVQEYSDCWPARALARMMRDGVLAHVSFSHARARLGVMVEYVDAGYAGPESSDVPST